MFQFLFRKKQPNNKLTREQEEDIVALLSRGNLALQEKRYMTTEDINEKRKEFLKAHPD